MRIFMSHVVVAALVAAAGAAHAAESCTNGSASGFECSHVDLVATMTPAELGGSGEPLNDIWGWTDPANGDEYAIIGMYDGTAFVRLAADGTPTYLGRLRATDGMAPMEKTSAPHAGKFCHDECGEGESTWRDVKVYGNHAFVVSEARGHGMQVFDLTRLRGVTSAPANDYVEDFHYDGIGHAHNIVINEDLARAYVVGAGAGTFGGLHVLDISTPSNPQFIGNVSSDGYTHDAHCVAYAGPSTDITQGDDICFAANEDTLTIWNVTDPQNPEMLARTTYSNTAYTHQLWLSEDHRYAYLNDELDESDFLTRTNTRVFDVSDPANPEFVRSYLGPTWSIDHNNYVKGRFLYQANYLAGLRILDIGDPENPVEAAYFDVAVEDSANFQGAWSNYPYFDSGLVLLSDIHAGLFILKPSLDASSNQADVRVVVTAEDDGVEAGEPVPATVTVSNAGGVAAEDLLVTMHVPLFADLAISGEPQGWTCSPLGDVVLCRIDSMAPDASAEFSLELTSSSTMTGEFVAMAYARRVDATPGDNYKSVDVSLAAADDDEPAPGDSGGSSSGGGAPGLPLLLAAAAVVALRWREAD